MTDGEAREMARDLVRGSIIEDACAQFIAQILKHTHDERIKPLQARAERLEATLRETAQVLRQCTFHYIQVEGQYHDREEVVSRADAALKGDDHAAD